MVTIMKKRILAFLLAAVMLLGLSGCTAPPEQPSSAELSLVIINGRHANGILPTMEMLQDSGISALIENAFTYYEDSEGYFHADGDITVVVNDGNPESVPLMLNGEKLNLNLTAVEYDFLQEDVADTAYAVLQSLLDDSQVADDPEADLIGSVLKATTILSDSNAANKAIIILDSGICTSGLLNMSAFDIQSDSIDILFDQMAPGAFPDLTGISVWFYGLGNVDETNQVTLDDDVTVQNQFLDFWTAYFQSCNAIMPSLPKITANMGGTPMRHFDKPTGSNRDSSGALWYPYVTNVAFRKTATQKPDILVFSESILNFDPGESTFLDGEVAAITQLTNQKAAFEAALSADPDVIFYVVGSVAKNKPHKVEEEGTLSWERAAAVAKIMIEHCGVPARNIRLIGAGFTTFTWRNAIEFPDGVNPSESNMKLNRVVAVVPSYSEQYTKELQSKNGSNKDLTAIACLYGDHPRSN